MIPSSGVRIVRRSSLFLFATLVVSGLGGTSASAQSYTVPDWSADTIRSAVLGETRRISIALPVGYDFTTMADFHYPVLIVLDGSYGSPGDATKILNARVRSDMAGWVIPPMIIVGIEPGRTRTRDMTPPPVLGQSSPRPGRGGSPAFAKFIGEELLPWLAQRYRTSPYTVVQGHSLSGLFAAWVYGQAPTKINAVLALSPTIIWSNEAYQQIIDGIRSRSAPGRFFIAASENEGTMIPVKTHQFLADVGSSPTPATTVLSQWYTDLTHGQAGLAGFTDGLQAIFRPVALGGLDGAASTSGAYLPEFERRRAAYRRAAPSYGLPPKLPIWFTLSQVLNLATPDYKNLNAAVLPVLCDELRTSYPESWAVPVCDGHAHLAKRDFEGAAAAFKQATDAAQRTKDQIGIGIARDGAAAVEDARRRPPG